LRFYHVIKQWVPLSIRTYVRHPHLLFPYRRDGVAMTERNLMELTVLRVLPASVQRRYHQAKDARIEARWVREGRPIPPPHVIKRKRIEEAARRFGIATMVETGTYKGDLIYALRQSFERIYSIEFEPRLHARAVKRFARLPHIRLLHGDSGERLREVLNEVSGPCLFWLDAHYSGGITGKAPLETPVRAELEAIAAHGAGHVVLVDDARSFRGQHDFPTLDELGREVARLFPGHDFAVQDDIISILPRRAEAKVGAAAGGTWGRS
jgi:hypothetical protein